uniref:MARVEL domain-containing protein n=1 Tax=Salarias fasciatus TaxID=181472 RepID=A0A672FHJ4_SALFA
VYRSIHSINTSGGLPACFVSGWWFAVPQLLSFVAFVLEESVFICTSCTPLYFFEFVSCTAFLFTLLLLILLSTSLYQRIGITCWPQLDFIYTGIIAVFLLISSIVFAADNTGSSLERGAVAFGFLAMVAFAADFLYVLKEHGHPFKRGAPPQEDMESAAPEGEKLNPPVNGTE